MNAEPEATVTELELKASEAWAMAVRADNRLPPAIALDMVQDVCGDRDDAVSAALAAAARWLEAATPEQDLYAAKADAVLVAGDIRAEDFRYVELLANSIKSRANGLRVQRLIGGRARVGDNLYATVKAWLAWCERATTAVALCRELVAAAHPEPAATEG